MFRQMVQALAYDVPRTGDGPTRHTPTVLLKDVDELLTAVEMVAQLRRLERRGCERL